MHTHVFKYSVKCIMKDPFKYLGTCDVNVIIADIQHIIKLLLSLRTKECLIDYQSIVAVVVGYFGLFIIEI